MCHYRVSESSYTYKHTGRCIETFLYYFYNTNLIIEVKVTALIKDLDLDLDQDLKTVMTAFVTANLSCSVMSVRMRVIYYMTV